MATGCGLTTSANPLYGVGGSPANLWAVGSDGTGAPGTMHWNGSTWTTVPAPSRGQSAELDKVSVLPSGKAWAVGAYYQGCCGIYQLIERWNGSEWRRSNAASPNDGPLQDVKAFSNRDVWAVGITDGGSGIEHYDGTAWSYVANPSSGTVRSIDGVAPDDIWAVPGSSTTSALHWDGSVWAQMSLPGDGSALAVAAGGADDVWAVGVDQIVNSHGQIVSQGVSWHWDGSVWTSVPMPEPGLASDVHGISATGGNAWAVGGYTTTGSDHFATLFGWSGTSWKLVTLPGDPATYRLSGVVGFTTSDVWGVGDTVIVHHC